MAIYYVGLLEEYETKFKVVYTEKNLAPYLEPGDNLYEFQRFQSKLSDIVVDLKKCKDEETFSIENIAKVIEKSKLDFPRSDFENRERGKLFFLKFREPANPSVRKILKNFTSYEIGGITGMKSGTSKTLEIKSDASYELFPRQLKEMVGDYKNEKPFFNIFLAIYTLGLEIVVDPDKVDKFPTNTILIVFKELKTYCNFNPKRARAGTIVICNETASYIPKDNFKEDENLSKVPLDFIKYLAPFNKETDIDKFKLIKSLFEDFLLPDLSDSIVTSSLKHKRKILKNGGIFVFPMDWEAYFGVLVKHMEIFFNELKSGNFVYTASQVLKLLPLFVTHGFILDKENKIALDQLIKNCNTQIANEMKKYSSSSRFMGIYLIIDENIYKVSFRREEIMPIDLPEELKILLPEFARMHSNRYFAFRELITFMVLKNNSLSFKNIFFNDDRLKVESVDRHLDFTLEIISTMVTLNAAILIEDLILQEEDFIKKILVICDKGVNRSWMQLFAIILMSKYDLFVKCNSPIVKKKDDWVRFGKDLGHLLRLENNLYSAIKCSTFQDKLGRYLNLDNHALIDKIALSIWNFKNGGNAVKP